MSHDSHSENSGKILGADPATLSGVSMGPCILWEGATNKKGYGIRRVKIDGIWEFWLAHRHAWFCHYGFIDKDLFICHHCDNPRCINVNHLFAGTTTDNQRDSSLKGRTRNGNYYKSACKHGHAFTEENTYINNRGDRVCKECHNGKRRKK